MHVSGCIHSFALEIRIQWCVGRRRQAVCCHDCIYSMLILMKQEVLNKLHWHEVHVTN